MRVLDTIRANGIVNPESLHEDVFRVVRGEGFPFPSILADGAINHHLPRMNGLEDYPCLAPPVERIFMEGRVAPQNWNRVEATQIGAFIQYYEVESLDAALLASLLRGFSSRGRFGTPDDSPLKEGELPAPLYSGRWLMVMLIFTDHIEVPRSRKLPIYMGKINMLLDDEGRIPVWEGGAAILVEVSDSINKITLEGYPDDPKGYEEEMYYRHGDLIRRASPFLFSISLMHCKNVDTVEEDYPPKLRKKFEKRHKVPKVVYRLLDINPSKTRGRRVSPEEATEIRRAFHLCRGHFKRYTPERGGPFGRPIEKPFLMWVSAHVKGRISEGVVVKDYNVKAPS